MLQNPRRTHSLPCSICYPRLMSQYKSLNLQLRLRIRYCKLDRLPPNLAFVLNITHSIPAPFLKGPFIVRCLLRLTYSCEMIIIMKTPRLVKYISFEKIHVLPNAYRSNVAVAFQFYVHSIVQSIFPHFYKRFRVCQMSL